MLTENSSVILLYETDFNHSYNSRVLLGIFTDKSILNSHVEGIIRKEVSSEYEFCEHYNFFIQYGQTQGLQNFELSSEIIILNTLL